MNVADYILHGLVVPVAVTYFSIRSRNMKGADWGAREKPAPAYAYVAAPLKSAVAEREARANTTSVPAVSATLAAFSF